MALTTAQLATLSRMSGEAHKAVEDRMVDDSSLILIAEENLIVDSSGYAPISASYTATYDLYRSASTAWRTKAGMVAEGYNVKVEGAAFNRSEVYDHYLNEAARYAGMAASLTTNTTPARA